MVTVSMILGVWAVLEQQRWCSHHVTDGSVGEGTLSKQRAGHGSCLVFTSH